MPARWPLVTGEGQTSHGQTEVLQAAGQPANLANIQPVAIVREGEIIQIQQLKLRSDPEINCTKFINYSETYCSRMMVSSDGSTLFRLRQLNCLNDTQLVKLKY